MSAQTATGVVMSILGLLLLLYSGYEFNNLFFIDRLLRVSDIPAYNGFVVMPFLLGNLALLDGAIALGLKRSFSVSIHLLGNVLWLYALYILRQPGNSDYEYHSIPSSVPVRFLGLDLFRHRCNSQRHPQT